VTTYEYNPDYGDWNLSKEIDPLNLATEYKYDSWDRVVKVIDYLGNESTTNFVESNNAYTVTSADDDGSSTIIEYDQLQRVSVVKEKNVIGSWISKKYEYDTLDRLIRESEPYSVGAPSQWNEIIYDSYGRPDTQTLYTGRVIDISYNQLTTTVNDGIKTVTTVRNQFGSIESITDPGGTINYTYYGNGNLKSSNYNGAVISVEQDGWGRKKKLTDPSAGVYKYEYNGFGELIEEITPKGSTKYEYELGRLMKKIVTGDNTPETIINYSYDNTHKYLDGITLASADGNNSTYTYGYDNYKRITSIKESNQFAQFTRELTYDGLGRVETESYDAKLFTNGKDSFKKVRNIYQNGVLKSIVEYGTNNNIWNLTGVTARGQLATATLGQGDLAKNIYDDYGYLSSMQVKNRQFEEDEGVYMNLGYDFNANRGTLNSRTNSMFSWSETFGYDQLDRLISFEDNDGDNNLEYDDRGRIEFNNSVGDYVYSGPSYQVSNIDLNTQGDIYYQQNQLEQVKYNAFKKPLELSEAGKETIGFQYNAFEGRSHMFYGDEESNILQRNNRKHYSYDGSMEISYDQNEDKTTFVTYIGGDAYTAPAIWRSEQTNSTEEGLFYLHRDYLGSILLITNGLGNVQEKRHFDAWGKAVKIENGSGSSLDKLSFLDRGYTGHEHLQGVGLIHMNGRLYDPNLKRFLSPDNFIQDPYNTQNYNRYGYVLNNPLMYTDPSGELIAGGAETGLLAALGGPWGAAIGLLAPSAYLLLKDAQIGRWLNNAIGKPIENAVNDVLDWIGGWFKKPTKPKVKYQNYQGLSSDPMAGSSMTTPLESFSGGGVDSGGLGISPSHSSQLVKIDISRQEGGSFKPIDLSKDSPQTIYQKSVNNVAHFLNLKYRKDDRVNQVTAEDFGVNRFKGSKSGYDTLVKNEEYMYNGSPMKVWLNFAHDEEVAIDRPMSLKQFDGAYRGYEFRAAARQNIKSNRYDYTGKPLIFRIMFRDINVYNQFIKDVNERLDYD